MTPDADHQAIQWMVRLSSGSASAADQAQFQQWRDAAPAHACLLYTSPSPRDS